MWTSGMINSAQGAFALISDFHGFRVYQVKFPFNPKPGVYMHVHVYVSYSFFCLF